MWRSSLVSAPDCMKKTSFLTVFRSETIWTCSTSKTKKTWGRSTPTSWETQRFWIWIRTSRSGSRTRTRSRTWSSTKTFLSTILYASIETASKANTIKTRSTDSFHTGCCSDTMLMSINKLTLAFIKILSLQFIQTSRKSRRSSWNLSSSRTSKSKTKPK